VITQLRIEGLAIIDSLEIEFSPGLNIITGETGAGKSILIRALHFVFGSRFGTEVIRNGFEAANVAAEFELPSGHSAVAVLEKLGLHSGGEGRVSVLVRRQLTQKGKSQGWINDTPVTATTLKEVGVHLIDIFAQHENQRLLDPAKHVHYLDLFLKDSGVLEKLRTAFDACDETISKLSSLSEMFKKADRDADYLAFRLEELKTFEPSVDEYQQTREYCLLAEKGQALREVLGQARLCLDGDSDSGAGAVSLLGDLARVLAKVRLDGDFEQLGENVSALKARADVLAVEASDLGFDFEKLFEKVEVDESLLEEKQARLYAYQNLFRKHGVQTAEALIGEQTSLEEQLGSEQKRKDEILELTATLASQTRALWEASQLLSMARMSAANVVQSSVQSELRELVMSGAVFETEFGSVRRSLPTLDFQQMAPEALPRLEKSYEQLMQVSRSGAERVQFLMATNPGEAVLPLAQIASGGEVSRVMLALKKALVADAETCVLVFDEIDTGISGRVADVVGRKMRELAESVQVICISHLPQVAVYADAHFLVDKRGAAGRTSSTIVHLSPDESAKEIARLLSGDEVSTDSLANAKSLMARARKGDKKPVSSGKPEEKKLKKKTCQAPSKRTAPNRSKGKTAT